MKKRLLGVLLLAGFAISTQAQKIVAYYPYYKSTVNSIQYSKITDIFYGFIGTDGNGNLTASCQKDGGGSETVFQQSEWNTMRGLAQAAGVNVHIAVGGANISNHVATSAAGASRSNFVDEIVDFVRGNHALNNTQIKGVDIDWEFPDNSTEIANHLLLCQELRAALDAAGNTDGVHYELSIAVGGSTRNMPGTYAWYHEDYLDTDCYQYIDFLNCMNYDLHYVYGHHSPVAGAEAVVERYVTTGINGVKLPAEKFVLGVPFYGKNGWADGADGTAWSSFASQTYLDDADGDLNGHKYNSKPMLETKADLVCQKGLAGVLIWEIAQDDPTYSLLDALYNRFNTSCSQYSCSAPDLGSDQTICGNTVTLDANITLQNGESIAWYRDGSLISGETGTTYGATVAGTYKAVVTTSLGCEKFDEIVISTGGDLTVTVENLGYVCEDYEEIDTFNVVVTGGGGFYNLYDAATGGNLIKSVTGTFEYGVGDVARDQQRTLYIEEPPGQTGSIGPTGPYTDGTAGWPFFDPNSTVMDGGTEYDQDWTMEFTTYSSITIQTIDFIFGYDPSLGANDNLHVIIYDDQGSIVLEKDVTLSAVNFSTSNAGDQHLNTVTINAELPTPGNYEISFKGTNTLLWMEKDWFNPPPNPQWPYVGTVSGANVISLTGTGNTDPDYSWDLSGNVVGMYNWVVSTGTGTSACGRVPFTIYHDCNTVSSTGEVNAGNFNVFPNPATDNVNVTFEVGAQTDANVELINSLGAIVSRVELGTIAAGNQNVNISTNDLVDGVYLVKVNTGGSTTTKTVVVTK